MEINWLEIMDHASAFSHFLGLLLQIVLVGALRCDLFAEAGRVEPSAVKAEGLGHQFPHEAMAFNRMGVVEAKGLLDLLSAHVTHEVIPGHLDSPLLAQGAYESRH